MNLIVFICSISLGFQDFSTSSSDSQRNSNVMKLNMAFNIIFIAEVLFKLAAYGAYS